MTNIELLDDPAGFNLAEHVKTIESAFIREALSRAKGNKAKAADMLGMRRTTLLEKMRKYGFELSEPYRKPILGQLDGSEPTDLNSL